MPDAEFPQKYRRYEEPAGEQREENIESRRPFFEDVKQRIVLDQGIGNKKRREKEYLFPIDADRIFAEFSGTVRKDVHKLQPVQRKKAHGGIDQKQPAKDRRAADQHENNGQDLGEIPDNAAVRDAVDEHHNSLYYFSDAGQFKFTAKHLNDLILRAHHDAVKFP